MKTYLVGGAVRDKLLGETASDRDWVVVGATPEQMQESGYRAVGKDFPVFLHPQTGEEYALARTERKVTAGYHGFTFNTSTDVTLEQDLLRRDLTINAIAEDSDGTLIDPGNGQTDLEARVLRHVSPAFAEDPLRVLRVARFAARLAGYRFEVAADTLHLMTQITASGELTTLAEERIWAEMHKVLGYPDPRPFFCTLRNCGALAVLLPELDCLFGVPQRAEYHPEVDSGVHTLLVLQQACELTDDVAVRFAALCHDLGKGTTPKAMLPAHHGHEERSAYLTETLCQRLKVPHDFRNLAVLGARYHLHCHRALELKASSVLKLFEKLDAFRRPARFEQFVVMCNADARGRTGFENQPYPQADYLREALYSVQQLDSGEVAAKHRGDGGPAIAAAIRLARLNILKTHVRQKS